MLKLDLLLVSPDVFVSIMSHLVTSGLNVSLAQ